MKKQNQDMLKYYSEELKWNPPFADVMARYLPGSLEGYLTMRDSVREGELPLKYRELIFTILDSIDDEITGAKAHASAAVKAGLSIKELVEAYVIVSLVKGINVMCKNGTEVIKEAEKNALS